MIHEELYIIKDGERLHLDLNSPSGIVLNFKGNLFGDLSKISASFTYTFKLPMTLNNRVVLNSPEDVRHTSSVSRRKYKCEFRQNGIDLFTDANLYVETTDVSNYNAVMTWGIVSGFDALKDADVSIRELGNGLSEIGRYGAFWYPLPNEFSNNKLLLHPYRGLSIYEESKRKVYCLVNNENEPVSKSNIPVVPIRYIVQRINEYFGTNFNFGAVYDGSDYWNSESNRYDSNDNSFLINRGVVPLVKTGLTDAQCSARAAVLTNFKFYAYSYNFGGTSINVPIDAWDGNKFPQIITFDIKQPQNNVYFNVGGGGNVTNVNWVFHKKDSTNGKIVVLEKFKLDGMFRVVFSGTNVPETKLSIYKRKVTRDEENSIKVNYVIEEIASVDGSFSDYTYVDGKLCDVYIFDFRKSMGMSPIELTDGNDSSSVYPYFFNFNRIVKSILDGKVEITPMGKLSDDVYKGYETDIFSNLPDIGCMEFMKSLFYAIGAFPGLSKNGEIIPLFYGLLKQNINNCNVYDWSKKIMSTVEDNPQKIDFKVSGFGQRNYYLLKNDDLEKTGSEEGEDVYESGKMVVICDNNSLEKEKTVIQLPWYGKYLKSGKAPGVATDKDMKYQEFDPKDYKYSSCEAKPALGLIFGGAEGKMTHTTDSLGNVSYTYSPNGVYRMFMEVFNPFEDVTMSNDYDFLQEIIYHPFVITEDFNLDEFDLRDLDYTKPIYLEKFNSYFAIVSIQRDANGKCKCELIKLP